MYRGWKTVADRITDARLRGPCAGCCSSRLSLQVDRLAALRARRPVFGRMSTHCSLVTKPAAGRDFPNFVLHRQFKCRAASSSLVARDRLGMPIRVPLRALPGGGSALRIGPFPRLETPWQSLDDSRSPSGPRSWYVAEAMMAGSPPVRPTGQRSALPRRPWSRAMDAFCDALVGTSWIGMRQRCCPAGPRPALRENALEDLPAAWPHPPAGADKDKRANDEFRKRTAPCGRRQPHAAVFLSCRP